MTEGPPIMTEKLQQTAAEPLQKASSISSGAKPPQEIPWTRGSHLTTDVALRKTVEGTVANLQQTVEELQKTVVKLPQMAEEPRWMVEGHPKLRADVVTETKKMKKSRRNR